MDTKNKLAWLAKWLAKITTDNQLRVSLQAAFLAKRYTGAIGRVLVLVASLMIFAIQLQAQPDPNQSTDVRDRFLVLPEITYKVWVDDLTNEEIGREKLWVESYDIFLGGKFKDFTDQNNRLVNKLGSSNSDYVHRAAYNLTRISKRKPALIALTNGLSHANRQVRANCASLLGFLKPHEPIVIRSLESSLKDKEFIVRRNAALALGEIRPFDPSLVITLSHVIDMDPNENVKKAAKWAAWEISQVLSFENYIAKLDDTSMLESISHVVCGAGEMAIPHLAAIIKNKSESLRKRVNAIVVLTDIRPVSDYAIKEYKYILNDDDFDFIKAELIFIMIKTVILSEDLVEDFVKLLDHQNYLIRAYAAGSLFMIGSAPKHTESKLRNMMMGSRHLIERLDAMLALKIFDTLTDETIRALEHLAHTDTDKGIRYVAKEVLKYPGINILRTRPFLLSDLPKQSD